MRRSVAVALVLALGVVLGIALAFVAPAPEERQAIEWLDSPRSVATFRLDTDAGHFDNDSLAGRWTVVLFGFLNCPDVCPTSLTELAALADRVSEDSFEQQVRLVFVSIDPARDSVTDVAQYARHFNAAILGVTGETNQLNLLADSLGVRFKVSADPEDYSVAHSITFSIIDPDGALRGRFKPGFDVSNLVQEFRAALTESDF